MYLYGNPYITPAQRTAVAIVGSDQHSSSAVNLAGVVLMHDFVMCNVR